MKWESQISSAILALRDCNVLVYTPCICAPIGGLPKHRYHKNSKYVVRNESLLERNSSEGNVVNLFEHELAL